MYNSVALGFRLSEMAVEMMISSVVKTNHPKSNLLNESNEHKFGIK
jgi:hypothetical protein